MLYPPVHLVTSTQLGCAAAAPDSAAATSALNLPLQTTTAEQQTKLASEGKPTGAASTNSTAPAGLASWPYSRPQLSVIFFGVNQLQERSPVTESHPSKGPAREGCNPTGTRLRRRRDSIATTWLQGRHLAVQLAQGKRRGPAMHLHIHRSRTVRKHGTPHTIKACHGRPRQPHAAPTPPKSPQVRIRAASKPAAHPPQPTCKSPHPQATWL